MPFSLFRILPATFIKIIIGLSVLFISNPLTASDYFIRLNNRGVEQRQKILSRHARLDSHLKGPEKSPVLRRLITGPRFNNWLVLSGQADSTRHLLDSLRTAGLVEFDEPVGRFKVTGLAVDSLQSGQWYLDKVYAREAWQTTKGDSQVIVGVIDTGVDYTHPDLQQALWRNLPEINGQPGVDDDNNGYIDDFFGWDFTDAPSFADGGDYLDEDNDPMDEYGSGHGTQVAGIIGAQINQIGIAGIAPAARLMVLRAGTASGYLEEDDVARAILYALDNGARIINMSFGDVVISQLLRDVIHYAARQGMVLVASAGNSGNDETHYPSGLAETISVGATTIDDYLAGFSSWGSTVDLTAPGDSILSTAVGGTYNVVNGTSFSAPMVAAGAALVLSANDQFTTAQVRNILTSSCDDILYAGWDVYSAAGRLNLARALSVPFGGILSIDQPQEGGSTAKEQLVIKGTALHPDLASLEVAWQPLPYKGKWQILAGYTHRQFNNDSLARLDLTQIEDGDVDIRLQMVLNDGRRDEVHRVLHVDRSAPLISQVQAVPLFDSGRRSLLVRFKSNDMCRASVFIRPCDQNVSWQEHVFRYRARDQILKIENLPVDGCYEYFIRAENASGLATVADNDGSFYRVSTDFKSYRQQFAALNWSLPGGFMLDRPTDLDHDGWQEIVLSRYDDNLGYGAVEVYEFAASGFERRLQTPFTAIPRDAADLTNSKQSALLLGYGQNTIIYQASDSTLFPEKISWLDSSSFWGARFNDVDSDGQLEVLGRRDSLYLGVRPQQEGYTEVSRLHNSSSGNNAYGMPLVIENDFDADGHPEIVFGDYDGDILVFTNGPGSRLPQQILRCTQSDATSLLAAAGNCLFAGSHSPQSGFYEHEVDARYWTVDFWQHDALSGKLEKREALHFSGYKNIKDFDSGLKAIELDGRIWLFVSLFPDLYIFTLEQDQLQFVWYAPDVRSNTVVVADYDKNGAQEFYFNRGTVINGFEFSAPVRPAYPFGFSVQPLDSSRIQLDWLPVAGAQGYQLWRAENQGKLFKIATTTNSGWQDSLLNNETNYRYALQTIDSTFEQPLSALSPEQTSRTSMPPRLLSAEAVADDQLMLCFDEAIKAAPAGFDIRLTGSGQVAQSAVRSANKKHILCTFSQPFTDTQGDTVTAGGVRDTNEVPLDQRFYRAALNYTPATQPPFISRVQILSRQSLELTFSIPMVREDVLDIHNYTLSPSGSIVTVTALDSLVQKVKLSLSKTSMAGAFGQPAYIEVSGLRSLADTSNTLDMTMNLISATDNLKEMRVYPQPVRPGQGELIFAMIPQNVEISVFTINGDLIWSFKGTSSYGGVKWNLKDAQGKRIAAGIYVYRITSGTAHRLGKIAIVR